MRGPGGVRGGPQVVSSLSPQDKAVRGFAAKRRRAGPRRGQQQAGGRDGSVQGSPRVARTAFIRACAALIDRGRRGRSNALVSAARESKHLPLGTAREGHHESPEYGTQLLPRRSQSNEGDCWLQSRTQSVASREGTKTRRRRRRKRFMCGEAFSRGPWRWRQRRRPVQPPFPR